jgi:hypothetical protein
MQELVYCLPCLSHTGVACLLHLDSQVGRTDWAGELLQAPAVMAELFAPSHPAMQALL